MFPRVGTIGWGHTASNGHFEVTTPWIPSANADFNGTVALALISFCAWIFIILKYAGPKVILHDLFGNKADKKDLPVVMYYIFRDLPVRRPHRGAFDLHPPDYPFGSNT